MTNAKNPGQFVDKVSPLDRNNPAAFTQTPVLDWSEMNQGQHFAQFYETDLFLADSLAGFVSAGLTTGESVVVVATPDHRLQLEGLLLEKGVDLISASSAGQYFALDAGKTLEEFMIHGLPDPKLFVRTISGLIEQAKSGGKSVRIFGEMVGLLWQQRNFEGAIRLEELWNRLHANDEFLLFCAYPIIGLGAGAFFASAD